MHPEEDQAVKYIAEKVAEAEDDRNQQANKKEEKRREIKQLEEAQKHHEKMNQSAAAEDNSEAIQIIVDRSPAKNPRNTGEMITF